MSSTPFTPDTKIQCITFSIAYFLQGWVIICIPSQLQQGTVELLKSFGEYIPPGLGGRQRDGIGSGGGVVWCVFKGCLAVILGSREGWISFLCPVPVFILAQSASNKAWRGWNTGLGKVKQVVWSGSNEIS